MSFEGLPIRSAYKGLKRPKSAGERSADAMFSAGEGHRPKKAPQSDGVPCPKCGKAHRGGTICNFAKGTSQFHRALADLVKGGTYRGTGGKFAPGGKSTAGEGWKHSGGRPRGSGTSEEKKPAKTQQGLGEKSPSKTQTGMGGSPASAPAEDKAIESGAAYQHGFRKIRNAGGTVEEAQVSASAAESAAKQGAGKKEALNAGYKAAGFELDKKGKLRRPKAGAGVGGEKESSPADKIRAMTEETSASPSTTQTGMGEGKPSSQSVDDKADDAYESAWNKEYAEKKKDPQLFDSDAKNYADQAGSKADAAVRAEHGPGAPPEEAGPQVGFDVSTPRSADEARELGQMPASQTQTGMGEEQAPGVDGAMENLENAPGQGPPSEAPPIKPMSKEDHELADIEDAAFESALAKYSKDPSIPEHEAKRLANEDADQAGDAAYEKMRGAGPPSGSGDPTGGSYRGANAPKEKPASKEERLKEAMEGLGKQTSPKAGTPEYAAKQKKEQWARHAYGDKKVAKPEGQPLGPQNPAQPSGAGSSAYPGAGSFGDKAPSFPTPTEAGPAEQTTFDYGGNPEGRRVSSEGEGRAGTAQALRDWSAKRRGETAPATQPSPDASQTQTGLGGDAPTPGLPETMQNLGEQADKPFSGSDTTLDAPPAQGSAPQSSPDSPTLFDAAPSTQGAPPTQGGGGQGGRQPPKPADPNKPFNAYDQSKPYELTDPFNAHDPSRTDIPSSGGGQGLGGQQVDPSALDKFAPKKPFGPGATGAGHAGAAARQGGEVAGGEPEVEAGIQHKQMVEDAQEQNPAAYERQSKQPEQEVDYQGKLHDPSNPHGEHFARVAGPAAYEAAVAHARSVGFDDPVSLAQAGNAARAKAQQDYDNAAAQGIPVGQIPGYEHLPGMPDPIEFKDQASVGPEGAQDPAGVGSFTGIQPAPKQPAANPRGAYPGDTQVMPGPPSGMPAPPGGTPTSATPGAAPPATPGDGTPPMRQPGRPQANWPGIGFQSAFSTGQAIGGAAGPGAVVSPTAGFAAQQVHGMLTPGASRAAPKGVSPVTARPAGSVQQSALKSMDALINWKNKYEQRAR